MQVIFKKCAEAVNNALNTKTYGLFYSQKQDADSGVHLHECCEVLFCISGGKTFIINDRIYDVNDGDIFVLNQFEAHKITSNPESTFKRYVLQLHPAFLYGNSTENTDLSGCFYMRNEHISNKIALTGSERDYIENLFNELKKESDYGDDIIKNLRVIEIITLLNGYFKQNNKDFHYVPTYENKVIEASISYIDKNITEKLLLTDIANHCFVSVNQLCYLFKKHLGTTVVKYIISKRITEAKKMLKKGESVSDTALSCGFSDYSNFIRTFKNVVGISPGKYSSTKD